jgi:hypothetical protein
MQRQALEILIRSKAGTQSGNVEEGAVGFRNQTLGSGDT